MRVASSDILPRSTRYRKENVVFHNGENQACWRLALTSWSRSLIPAWCSSTAPAPLAGVSHILLWLTYLLAMDFATLVYDKRGTGESSGDWRTAGPEELASDVQQALAWLRRHPRIKPDLVGLWGISEGGGWTGPLGCSERTERLRF